SPCRSSPFPLRGWSPWCLPHRRRSRDSSRRPPRTRRSRERRKTASSRNPSRSHRWLRATYHHGLVAAGLWEASRVPWVPELFSAPALARVEDRLRQEELDTVPYYAGFLTGETDALVQSFAGEPEVHYPVRGRVRGERAFAAYAAATQAWLAGASIEEVGLLSTERRSVGEAVLHLAGEGVRVDLP